MAHSSNASVVVTDQDLRNALIRTNIALLQREVREKKHWYNSRRVVVRKRNGRIHLSRLGSQQHQNEYISVEYEDDEEESQNNDFTLVDKHPLSSRSASSSFSVSST
ncbi:uncharacterized protein GGS25DRAFT_524950 [Hypoxylon fragiforme]|uniref:uncharacterized protein n=1 Tax=Hypoxylon fragiforme TaxID=63214 RepID=UPI0020C6B9A0|nr:uncharacterized protein GGS25DRAFT_524950 [Hypoxylon fragiforme]KAI2605434.1 hypothetical protein GGS25DRAFT_524950 [Hypoxylon fragiforme]